jgi:hypothetical protein
MESLKPKMDYLYQSLGGTPAILRRYPAYLSYDLNDCIRPRAEFLKAFNRSPVMLGLAFFLKASPLDLAAAAGVELEVYRKFTESFKKNLSKKNVSTSTGTK